ncbi:MAG TPA: DUF3305 domain-containing protein [Beijerinckiaceae bacterium]|jgi:hypothetical protein
MPREFIEVGVVVTRRRLNNPWVDAAWAPSAVLPAAPAVAAWTSLGATEGEETFYAGAFALELHSGETSHYRDNLVSARPSLWVALRPTGGDEVEVAAVTADPYEGEALAETMGQAVEALPMPAEIQERIEAFFAAFHVERPFFKRQRNRADPETLAHRGPIVGRREAEDQT